MVHLWVLFALATLLLTACGVSPTPDLDATIQAPAAATSARPLLQLDCV